MTTPLSPFHKFSSDAAIIGRLLSGDTYIEVSLLFCVQGVRDNLDTTLKVMFRTQGKPPLLPNE